MHHVPSLGVAVIFHLLGNIILSSIICLFSSCQVVVHLKMQVLLRGSVQGERILYPRDHERIPNDFRSNNILILNAIASEVKLWLNLQLPLVNDLITKKRNTNIPSLPLRL